jgi:hypothetical protein
MERGGAIGAVRNQSCDPSPLSYPEAARIVSKLLTLFTYRFTLEAWNSLRSHAAPKTSLCFGSTHCLLWSSSRAHSFLTLRLLGSRVAL